MSTDENYLKYALLQRVYLVVFFHGVSLTSTGQAIDVFNVIIISHHRVNDIIFYRYVTV